MDTIQAKLRVNLAQREFEVAGSEEFVRAYAERIEALLDRLAGDPVAIASLPAEVAIRDQDADALGEFGSYIQRLPGTATEVDTMLAAGFFAQAASADDTFATAEANKRLLEQGIKLGNPSQCVRQSLVAKRVFLVARGRFRVSQHGRAHLRQLLGPMIPE
ncbi:MAG TPA: hypothetical protein VHL31_14370 [Geminicoccus sp.]|uniref:hypothetical protein n=1 Tax=Geminicoccus sp. TaxID=2024832 RepID=UPI002E37E252|nr:hypothetical protein [Geminicoccus sp.]HEX2527468.1 hypothetical protein [Geminicoccus sp.]